MSKIGKFVYATGYLYVTVYALLFLSWVGFQIYNEGYWHTVNMLSPFNIGFWLSNVIPTIPGIILLGVGNKLQGKKFDGS